MVGAQVTLGDHPQHGPIEQRSRRCQQNPMGHEKQPTAQFLLLSQQSTTDWVASTIHVYTLTGGQKSETETLAPSSGLRQELLYDSLLATGGLLWCFLAFTSILPSLPGSPFTAWYSFSLRVRR